MKKHVLLYWLALGLLVITGCQKEVSFETGNSVSHGSLQSDATSDCLPKTVNGAYIAATPLVPTTNTITVQVNVAATGSYTVSTDTVNGYHFQATGIFTTTGTTNVTLRSSGTPFAAGVDNFIVRYDTSVCDIFVTVLPVGTGAAVFTFDGAPGACIGAVVSGTYATGVTLNATNTVGIAVNVTTIGTFTVTTTFQGMVFTASGAFATTGANTIVLTGAGIPTTGGVNTVPLTVGTTTCNFVVNVASPAVGTLGGGPGACTPSTVAGTYTVGTALTNSNTVQVQISTTTPGAFSISSDTQAGFSFAGSGTAIAGPPQLITLIATGTPSSAGVKTFTLTFGTSTCTFTVNVQAAAGAAVGTLDGSPTACTPATVGGTYTTGVPLTGTNTVQVQIDVATAGTYTISATSTPTPGFSFSGSGTVPAGNNQLITLNGTGTPAAAGTITFTVTFGTSTCTFTVTVGAPLPVDYFPRTVGSNWSYEVDDNPNVDSFYRYVIPNTHPLGHNIFLYEDGSGPDSSGYYRKSGGDYFEWFNAAAYFGFSSGPVWAEYIMLRDNVGIGVTWKTAGFAGTIPGPPPQNVNVRFSFTITGKDVVTPIVTSLGTQNFTNVIVVEQKLELEIAPGVWQDITSGSGFARSYYARGIGLIQFELLDGSGGLVYKEELRRYQVL